MNFTKNENKMNFLFAIIVTCAIRIQDTDASYLSYKKPVKALTVYFEGTKQGATDGNAYAILGPWCYHSAETTGNYLQVDLQKTYDITSVTIINRSSWLEDSVERLEGAEIRISSEMLIGSGEQCGNFVSTVQVEESPIIDLICQPSIRGRYVTLRQSINEIINICEILVYSENQHNIIEFSEANSGEDYRGLVAITSNGRVCQDWQLDTPHSHSIAQDEEKGIGWHNMCRNPDSKPNGPWCYTTDPDVQWEYCDVGDINSSCPFGFDGVSTLNPNTINSLSLSFFILPGSNSLGSIIEFGNDQTNLSISQTWSNKNLNLYQAEISIFYGGEEITRAYILLQNKWTHVTLTFDGKNKNMKLWRNGEIASIGYTTFTHLSFSYTDIKLHIGTGSNLNARISMANVFYRVLSEADIKNIRDQKNIRVQVSSESITKGMHNGILMKKVSAHPHTGIQILRRNCQSLIRCSIMCLGNAFCEGFKFEEYSCMLLVCINSSFKETEESGVYYQRTLIKSRR